ncbi:MAG: PASTA domain-containing protein [Bacteroidia bacterium]|nr:PASTA domain-containing protein [Bacteroidia bacterium]
MGVKKIDTKKVKQKAGKYAKSWVAKNIVLGIAFVLAVVLSVSLLLSLITQHNKEINVPDFTNLTYSEAKRLASHSNVKIVVSDSLYVRRLKPGVVCSQTPEAGAKVKRGRKIRLTTNTIMPKQVSMPSLVGFSMRQARAEIVRNGLVLGRLIYVNDIATNNVLHQQFNGKDILPGEKITSGSVINLVVGLSNSESRTFVPNVIGRTYQRAVDNIQDNSLNIGKLSFDASVENYADSVMAVVYAQKPESDSKNYVRKGSEVTLFLTADPDKIAGINKK